MVYPNQETHDQIEKSLASINNCQKPLKVKIKEAINFLQELNKMILSTETIQLIHDFKNNLFKECPNLRYKRKIQKSFCYDEILLRHSKSSNTETTDLITIRNDIVKSFRNEINKARFESNQNKITMQAELDDAIEKFDLKQKEMEVRFAKFESSFIDRMELVEENILKITNTENQACIFTECKNDLPLKDKTRTIDANDELIEKDKLSDSSSCNDILSDNSLSDEEVASSSVSSVDELTEKELKKFNKIINYKPNEKFAIFIKDWILGTSQYDSRPLYSINTTTLDKLSKINSHLFTGKLLADFLLEIFDEFLASEFMISTIDLIMKSISKSTFGITENAVNMTEYFAEKTNVPKLETLQLKKQIVGAYYGIRKAYVAQFAEDGYTLYLPKL